MGTEALFAHTRTDNNFEIGPWSVDNSSFAMNLSPGLLLDKDSLEVQ
jgi:hypothetical protein